MLNTDSCFSIGKTHKVCEDYARAGTFQPNLGVEPRAYAIVSDGCSASPDTDFGARLLTVAAQQRLNVFGDEFDPNWAIWQAAERVRPPLSPTCLDATLLVVHERADSDVGVLASGDGVVAAVRHDGTVEVWDIDFNGVPGYLSYQLDPERLAHFLELGHGHRSVRGYVGGEPKETATSSVAAPQPADGWVWTQLFDRATYKLVMVMSDGVHSFWKQDDLGRPSNVPFLEVVNQLVAIKGFAGSFVARRAQAFLKRYCVKHGWYHNDDLAVAAIHCPLPDIG